MTPSGHNTPKFGDRAGRGRRVKLVGYVRVSTDRQAEEGQGLDVQIEAIRAWAKRNDYHVSTILREEGVSGSNGIEHQVALPDALQLVEAGKVAGIVVYRLDRLARDLMLRRLRWLRSGA
jgi:DNA invertase Pin-like site-specific DNA recombinase